MAAGLGFKTFTTGEVLTAGDVNGYLMQGINVFASSAARAAAITSPQEGQYSFLKDTNALEYYDGAAWVGAPVGDITAVTAGKGLTGGGSSGDVTVSLGTTAKGDLVAGTGTTTAAALTVGNNGETLVADSSTSTGLRYNSNFAAGKNKLINGDMGIWQRGTSVAVPGNNTQTFQADRFWAQHNGTTNGTCTYSRQSFTVGQTDVPNNPLYFARVTNTTLGTSQTQTEFGQSIEDVTTFAGQTATFSFYVKASAAFTLTGFAYQNFGSGGSGSVFTTLTLSTSTTTTSWQKITATVSVPSVSGKTVGAGNYIAFYIRQGTPTAASTIDFSNWQVEAGSVATAFQTATGTLQGELAACQRYYFRTQETSSSSGFLTTYGAASSTTEMRAVLVPPVSLRVNPTSIDYGTLRAYDGSGFITITSIALGGTSKNNVDIVAQAASGFTTYRPTVIAVNGATQYIGLSAEL
jgi:hypothetical protein